MLFYLIVRNRLHDILAPNIDRYNIQQYEFIACPPKLEQADLLRRNKQRGAGGTLRRPPNNGITVLDIPSGGGVSSKKKKFCTPCRCISSLVVIFLALLYMRGRAVLYRAAWPLKSNTGGVGLRSSIQAAKLDEQPG